MILTDSENSKAAERVTIAELRSFSRKGPISILYKIKLTKIMRIIDIIMEAAKPKKSREYII